MQPSPEIVPEVTTLGPIVTMLRYRRRVVTCVVLGIIGGIVWATLTATRYTSSASMIPEGRRSSSGASGLAAQFGISLPLEDPGQSPQFYADLFQSKLILTPVALTPYTVLTPAGAKTGNLIAWFHAQGATQALKQKNAIDHLRKSVDASVSLKTGVITLQVTAPDPQLAQHIAQRLLEEVNTFNLDRRQSQARVERVFAQKRLLEASADLRASEDRLTEFLQTNRDYHASPRLTLEQARLSRDIAFKQELYSTLNTAYERARLDEVRDSPVITILDTPSLSILPDSRGRAKHALLGGLLGIVIALSSAYWSRIGNRLSESEPIWDQYQLLKRQASHDIRRPWRLFGWAAQSSIGS